jgi:uncharacterized protein YndB with AHSA1/START domain
MEQKTQLKAEDGKHDILITREFDLPVDLLFKAHVDAEIFEQWMSHEYGTTRVLKLDSRPHGGWKFQTSDAVGNVLFTANGVIHDIKENEKIIRTFEMEGTPFPPTLEFLEFEKLPGDRSKLSMQMIYRSVAYRDEMLKLPFRQGLSMAHDRLQQVLSNIKSGL